MAQQILFQGKTTSMSHCNNSQGLRNLLPMQWEDSFFLKGGTEKQALLTLSLMST